MTRRFPDGRLLATVDDRIELRILDSGLWRWRPCELCGRYAVRLVIRTRPRGMAGWRERVVCGETVPCRRLAFVRIQSIATETMLDRRLAPGARSGDYRSRP